MLHRVLWLGLLAIMVLAILGPYLAFHREARTLDVPAREALGGTYVTLPSGVTHYELTGRADGPVVVLIHGGTTRIGISCTVSVAGEYWISSISRLR